MILLCTDADTTIIVIVSRDPYGTVRSMPAQSSLKMSLSFVKGRIVAMEENVVVAHEKRPLGSGRRAWQDKGDSSLHRNPKAQPLLTSKANPLRSGLKVPSGRIRQIEPPKEPVQPSAEGKPPLKSTLQDRASKARRGVDENPPPKYGGLNIISSREERSET